MDETFFAVTIEEVAGLSCSILLYFKLPVLPLAVFSSSLLHSSRSTAVKHFLHEFYPGIHEFYLGIGLGMPRHNYTTAQKPSLKLTKATYTYSKLRMVPYSFSPFLLSQHK